MAHDGEYIEDLLDGHVDEFDNNYDENANLDFRRDVDPNVIYELVSLIGEGSYGAVYKAYLREGQDRYSDGARYEVLRLCLDLRAFH